MILSHIMLFKLAAIEVYPSPSLIIPFQELLYISFSGKKIFTFAADNCGHLFNVFYNQSRLNIFSKNTVNLEDDEGPDDMQRF